MVAEMEAVARGVEAMVMVAQVKVAVATAKVGVVAREVVALEAKAVLTMFAVCQQSLRHRVLQRKS